MPLSPDNLRHFLEPFFEQLTMLQDDLNKAEETGILLPQCEFWLAQLHDELEIKNQEIKIFLSSTNKIDDKIDFIQIWLEVIRPNKQKIALILRNNNPQASINQINQKLDALFKELFSFEGVPYIIYLTETISYLGEITSSLYNFDEKPDFLLLTKYQIELNNLLLRVKRELTQINDEFENLHRFYLVLSASLFLELWPAVSHLPDDLIEEVFTPTANLFQLEQIKEISVQTIQLRQLIDNSWHTTTTWLGKIKPAVVNH